MGMTIKRTGDFSARICFDGLRGNGLRYATRETLRFARKIHLVCDYTVFCDTVVIYLYTRRDERRLTDLWQYLTGKRFQRKILNNGRWEREV